MIKVGLTGGIGSGKTTVCNVFNHLGIAVYHADIHAKLLSDKNTEIRESLISLFGSDIYDNWGLDRKKLSGIIFSDKKILQKVNAIIHPKVFQHFNEWLADKKNSKYIIHEAAILFESGSRKHFEKVITVTAPEEIRIKRVMLRDDVSHTHVKNIMNNQMPEADKISNSDYIIENDDKTPVLPQILRIHSQLSSLKDEQNKKKMQ